MKTNLMMYSTVMKTLTIMKVKERVIFEDCVESGICYGWNRAHKHTDTPCEITIKNAIYDGIILMIDECFTFDQLIDKPEED